MQTNETQIIFLTLHSYAHHLFKISLLFTQPASIPAIVNNAEPFAQNQTA